MCGFCMQTETFGTELQVCMGLRPHLWFWAHITACLAQEWKDYMGSSLHLWLCACKSATLAHELLVPIGASPHLWFCAFKTATLGSKLHVSMGPRPHLLFSAFKTACLASELLVSMGPSPHVLFLDAKQWLLDWIKKYMSPDVTCRFVHANQRDLHQNDKSIWVPALICVFFFIQNSVFRTRLTSLHGSQTSSVVLSTHNSVLSTRI